MLHSVLAGCALLAGLIGAPSISMQPILAAEFARECAAASSEENVVREIERSCSTLRVHAAHVQAVPRMIGAWR